MYEKTSSVRPRAVISRSALLSAASTAVAAGGDTADLRCDAWGHGLFSVAQAVTAAGASKVLVDHPRHVEFLGQEGITAVTDSVPNIDRCLLYGLPDADGVLETAPVMRLVGRVLSTKKLRAGDGVSYGLTHRAPADTVVALVSGGYAQGIVRSLGNKIHVVVDGALRPVVGRIAMDVCVVDLEGVDVAVGTEVTFFGGSGLAAPALAQWAGITGLSMAELIVVVGSHAERDWEV